MTDTALQLNKGIARRYVDEVQNNHDLDALESIFAADFVDNMNTFGGAFQSLEGIKRGYAVLLAAFPDLRAQINCQVAENDKVVTFKTVRGTHLGDFFGISASGNKVEFDVMEIVRVADGKIVEYWGTIDQLRLLQEMGVIPDISPLQTARRA